MSPPASDPDACEPDASEPDTSGPAVDFASAEGLAGADAEGRPHRRVTSFVRRGSRLTASRQRAWDAHASRYVLDVPRDGTDTGVEPAFRLDPAEVFGRSAPLIVEIGSGLGETLAHAAAEHPERDHLGFEVYVPGVAQTLQHLERAGLPGNVRLLVADAQTALPALLPEASVAEAWIFFPDPWHKARHHKRRLVSPSLVADLAQLLVDGGTLRVATDWQDYAARVREILDAAPLLANTAADRRHLSGPLSSLPPDRPGARPRRVAEMAAQGTVPRPVELPEKGWAPRFDGRPRTSFERKAVAAGRTVFDVAFTRVPRH